MLSAAGATKVRKSEGAIHEGTASTASITPSVTGLSRSGCLSDEFSGFAQSRNTWTTPSGRLVDPELVSFATN